MFAEERKVGDIPLTNGSGEEESDLVFSNGMAMGH